MNLRNLVFAAILLSVAACAQKPLDAPYQIRYASNLMLGESFINISNTGSSGGVTLQAGTSATVGGAICINIYSFTFDEQIVQCCSCPVTPNGLVSLGVSKDLTQNPLNSRGIPSNVVVKLVATSPIAGSCSGSAAAITSATPLAQGMVAWGTTLHVVGGTLQLTETAFTPATPSASELNRLGSICSFILAQGSGAGVCDGCRFGGLGAVAQ
jgi:hypothetical protein